MNKLCRSSFQRFRPFLLNFRPASTNKETHYEILNVKPNSSTKEIRVSFFKLSKKYHPDAAGGDNARFLQISEAYQVLSKPTTRQAYDLTLQVREHSTNDSTINVSSERHVHRPWEIRPNYGPTNHPYYGIKGMRKASNAKVTVLLVFFALVGSIVGFTSVKQSFSKRQHEMDDVSRKASQHHASIRSEAEQHGNEKQLQKMIDRWTVMGPSG